MDHSVVKMVAALLLLVLVACQAGTSLPETEKLPAASESPYLNVHEGDSHLADIFDRVQSAVVAVRTVDGSRMVSGSGIVVDRDGHILTNLHIVSGSGSIEIGFYSGLVAEGELVGSDEISDLAVLKAKQLPPDLQPLALGNSDGVRIGQQVLAIGNPIGLHNSLTAGIVSGLGRAFRQYGKVTEAEAFASSSVIQTDAGINQGNSGGPLIDLNGDVLGLISAQLTSGFDRSISGIGFAISSNVARRIYPQLIEKGKFDYPYLGVISIGDLSLADRKALGLENGRGIYVAELVEGSPADKAGLRVGAQISRVPGVPSGGDLIVKVDGLDAINFETLISYIVLNKAPGEDVILTVIRSNEEMEMRVTLGTQPG